MVQQPDKNSSTPLTPGITTLAPRHCPRCGGLMYKPANSLFYWHADNNHPRCDITNLFDPLAPQLNTEVKPSANSPADKHKG